MCKMKYLRNSETVSALCMPLLRMAFIDEYMKITATNIRRHSAKNLPTYLISDAPEKEAKSIDDKPETRATME